MVATGPTSAILVPRGHEPILELSSISDLAGDGVGHVRSLDVTATWNISPMCCRAISAGMGR